MARVTQTTEAVYTAGAELETQHPKKRLMKLKKKLTEQFDIIAAKVPPLTKISFADIFTLGWLAKVGNSV